jgi:hypothetical protein
MILKKQVIRHHLQKNGKKILVPKLVSSFMLKKQKFVVTTNFLLGIAHPRSSRNVDLADHGKSMKKVEIRTINISKPTQEDY